MASSITEIEPIKLDESNPWSNASQIVFSNGQGVLKRTPVDYTPKEGDSYHTVKNGEILTAITYQYYQGLVETPSRWWHVIADANQIHNPLDLTSLVGTEIVIPNLTNFRLLRS